MLLQDGKFECCDGDKRRPGKLMTLCGRWICWDGDRGRLGGKMNSCGCYVRD